MALKFLFISTPLNRSFAEVLAQVLAPYGVLEVSAWQDQPPLSSYDLVFLDAGVIAESLSPAGLSASLAQLLREHPDARIVITSASPTWKRTRDALKVGALDIIRQTLNADRLWYDLKPTLEKYLDQTPPD